MLTLQSTTQNQHRRPFAVIAVVAHDDAERSVWTPFPPRRTGGGFACQHTLLVPRSTPGLLGREDRRNLSTPEGAQDASARSLCLELVRDGTALAPRDAEGAGAGVILRSKDNRFQICPQS